MLQTQQTLGCLDSQALACPLTCLPATVPGVHVQIEAAYDVLFMQSMKKRISGELEVSSSVRYADVPTRKRSSSVSALNSSQATPTYTGSAASDQHRKMPLCLLARASNEL
jgi:hypothetical protein